MHKYLVTGGAGFIGSHIAEKLVELGHEVVIFDNFSTGKIENLDGIKGQIRIVQGDIRDLSSVREAVKGVDYITHHAAQISVPKSVSEPGETLEINTRGTLNVLMAAQESGIKKITFASSSAVYGDTTNIPTNEEEQLRPLSPYAVSKALSEYYCSAFAHLYNMDIVIFRYFNVFGPRQDPSSQYSGVISKFIDRAKKGEKLELYGDGSQTRDFIPVDKVASFNISAFQKELKGAQIFNLGSGKTIQINELAKQIVDSYGGRSQIMCAAARQGDIMHSCADISRITGQFDVSTDYSLAEYLANI